MLGDSIFIATTEVVMGWSMYARPWLARDVFFYHIGVDLGVDRIARYAKAFGLGSV